MQRLELGKEGLPRWVDAKNLLLLKSREREVGTDTQGGRQRWRHNDRDKIKSPNYDSVPRDLQSVRMNWEEHASENVPLIG